jgi:hypothetical protein
LLKPFFLLLLAFKEEKTSAKYVPFNKLLMIMLHAYDNLFKRTRFLWVVLLLSWIASPLYAQVASGYAFSQASGTYTPIAGGTVPTITSSTFGAGVGSPMGPGNNLDDVSATGLPIGFTFNFNSVDYTTFSVNSNGYLVMGSTLPSNGDYSPISSTFAVPGVIAALPGDLQSILATGEIRYQTTGSAPNRVLTVQWTDFRFFAATGDDFDFQIQLYETTNQIRIVYGNFVKNATPRTPQVGLRGATNADFNNRTTTTNWAASTAGGANNATMTLSTTVLPASGLTFIWSVVPQSVRVVGLNSALVASGSAASLLNGTNYGGWFAGASIERTFFIKNIGATTITISSLTSSNPTNFQITGFPALGIIPGDSTAFRVRFTGATNGTFTSVVTLNSTGSPNPYVINLSGQIGNFVSSYAFGQCSGTYTEITGGTLLFSGDTWDDNSTTVTIPSFTFNGSAFTSAHFNANGYIVLGGAINTFSGIISNTTTLTTGGAIAGFSGDLQGQPGSELRYQQVGNEAIFQWKGAKRWGTTGTGDNINFQIRLNTTNGQIRVVYGASATTSTSSSGIQVGLRGLANTDFNNRESASNWATSTAGTANTSTISYSSTVTPPAGLTYIWSPRAMEVLGGSPLALVPAGSITPSIANGTAFGTAAANEQLDVTFTIRNSSSGTLNISSITSSAPQFTIVAPAPTSVAGICASPNTNTFIVRFSEATVGSYTADITVNSNSPGLGAYVFRVSASVANPSISVLGGSGPVLIPNNSTTPLVVDGTDFGNVNTNSLPNGFVEQTYTIQNSGGGNLRLEAITSNNPRFTVSAAPASPVAPSGSTTFTLRFTPITSGVQNATITIPNNDPSAAPYRFAVRATAVQPVMQVLGLGNNIPNNKFLSTTTDGTFIGVATSSGTISSTFTIRNTGNDPLTITSISAATSGSAFSIAGAPSSIAGGSEADFSVVFNPTNGGKQDTIVISSNFPAAPTFRFVVSAGGVVSSLSDNLSEGDVLISPNPSVGNFNIKIGGARYTSVKAVVYDVAGRQVKNVEVPQFNGSMDINLEGLQGGTYILMLETGGEKVARKLIKQ